MIEELREGKPAHSQRQSLTNEKTIELATLSLAAEEAIMRLARLIGRQIAREQFETQARNMDDPTSTDVNP